MDSQCWPWTLILPAHCPCSLITFIEEEALEWIPQGWPPKVPVGESAQWPTPSPIPGPCYRHAACSCSSLQGPPGGLREVHFRALPPATAPGPGPSPPQPLSGSEPWTMCQKTHQMKQCLGLRSIFPTLNWGSWCPPRLLFVVADLCPAFFYISFHILTLSSHWLNNIIQLSWIIIVKVHTLVLFLILGRIFSVFHHWE